MNSLIHKLRNQWQRKHRVRATVSGSKERPRLSVHISNKNITAQIIDDEAGKTLGLGDYDAAPILLRPVKRESGPSK